MYPFFCHLISRLDENELNRRIDTDNNTNVHSIVIHEHRFLERLFHDDTLYKLDLEALNWHGQTACDRTMNEYKIATYNAARQRVAHHWQNTRSFLETLFPPVLVPFIIAYAKIKAW
jgi:hypothetical protein